MAKLGAGIRTMKRSEIHRELSLLDLEARLFVMAKAQLEETKKAISNYIMYADSFKPLLSGENLKQMGIKEGPLVGEILETLKDAKIDMGLTTKEEEIGFIRNYLQEREARQ